MLTSENCIRLCPNCPGREWEGTSGSDAVTGDLVERRPRYMNARAEFVADPTETSEVPTQEFATVFVDVEGNKTSAFLPGVQLEDIAACDKPVVSGRSGLLHTKKLYDCGAQAVKLAALRNRLQ